jgi:hypothetical protein
MNECASFRGAPPARQWVATIVCVALAISLIGTGEARSLVSRVDRSNRHPHFKHYKRSLPPARHYTPVVPSETVQTGTSPSKEEPEHFCRGLALLHNAPLSLGVIEWTVGPGKYGSRPLLDDQASRKKSACRSGFVLIKHLATLRLIIGHQLLSRAWSCVVKRAEVTCRKHHLELLALSVLGGASPEGGVTSASVEAVGPISLDVDLSGPSPLAEQGQTRTTDPTVTRELRRLRYFYVIGRHACGVSAASTETSMIARGGLIQAGEGPRQHFSYGSLEEGTYRACLYLQRTADDRRAVALAEASAVAFTLPALRGSSTIALPIDEGQTTRTYKAEYHGVGVYSSGAVAITVTLTETSEPTPRTYPPVLYDVNISLAGSACRRSPTATTLGPRCVSLAGHITGSGAGEVVNLGPQRQWRFGFEASGQVSHLGAVSARGSLSGTGFVFRGRRTAYITLNSRHRSTYLLGQGPVVQGLMPP